MLLLTYRVQPVRSAVSLCHAALGQADNREQTEPEPEPDLDPHAQNTRRRRMLSRLHSPFLLLHRTAAHMVGWPPIRGEHRGEELIRSISVPSELTAEATGRAEPA